jgi:hypothetical protein
MQSQQRRTAGQRLLNVTLHVIQGGKVDSRNLSPSEFSKLALEARRLRYERLLRAAGDADAQVAWLGRAAATVAMAGLGFIVHLFK